MRRLLTWALWIILIAAVVGVGYFAWRYLTGGAQEEAGQQVIVACTTECAERGQCGTTMDEAEVPVVLAGKDAPIVAPQQHDAYFLAGSTVEIRESMAVTLRDADGREFEHTFSRVQFLNPIGDIAETGWVPEWCIERP